ncbi:hypothetical protein [Runella slithyformis]|uniref:Calx-beta domain-containing protein n=1 Tax=Runella slithyformis (strain ATCC 29530 / DSM 19594 / LMG 11500 / NCIMB 11436 / LSU 4) TaxID=761193 RepID=A0A7U3ZKP1_RUNSL|nr:hypothetical protein [Runella slithyformis]AEI48936.1 hypothetical protein Runsl_2532 [Runella slithyformis DSM 19594]
MKINKYLFTQSHILPFVILAGLWLSGCEEQRIIYDGLNFVRFTDSTLSFKESYSKAIKIKVHNGGKVLNESINIKYTIGGTAREGRDYRIEGTKGTVIIPVGQSFGEITLYLLNNANNILESSTIEFALTSVSPSDKIKVGFGEGGLGQKMVFTIRDACIMEGIYTGRLPVGNQAFQLADIDISSTDCKRYTISNINVGLLGFPQFFNWESPVGFEAERPKLDFIDNGNNTLTIPRQVIPQFSSGYDTLSGTGVWNPVNKQITLSIKMKIYKLSNRKDSVVNLPLIYVPQ